jgi:hypothetical protein
MVDSNYRVDGWFQVWCSRVNEAGTLAAKVSQNIILK